MFGRLGLRDIDLNLHHILEAGVPVEAVAGAVAAPGCGCRWCPAAGAISSTTRRRSTTPSRRSRGRSRSGPSSASRRCGCSSAGSDARTIRRRRQTSSARNLSRLSMRHPGVRFVFENHDGASLDPVVCREILDRVARPNIRMNFDPINFAKAGVDPAAAPGRRSARRRPRPPEGARARRVSANSASATSIWGRWSNRSSRRDTRDVLPSSTRAASTAHCGCTGASSGRGPCWATEVQSSTIADPHVAIAIHVQRRVYAPVSGADGGRRAARPRQHAGRLQAEADPADGAHLQLHLGLRRPVRDVQQLEARRSQVGHDARAARAGDATIRSGARSRT